MHVITFLNEKGGVGKTTLAVLLASYLGTQGYRTLLIDADSQGHATLSVRQKRQDALYALLQQNASVDSVCVPVHPEFYQGDPNDPALWLLPSSGRTAELTKGLNPILLRDKLTSIQSVFDFVIIDTSPSISDLHLSFYVAADYIVYPTECTYMPMQGLFKSLGHLQQAKEHYAQQNVRIADVLGIVPTKFSARESVQNQNYGYLMGKYDKLVMRPVRRLTDFEKASQMRMPIYLYNASGNAARDALQFVNDVLDRLGEKVNA